jgi:pyruvate formate lyase activating enzyme
MFLVKKCVGCGCCVKSCPQRAISLDEGKASIDRKQCICCGTCECVCLNEAMEIIGEKRSLSAIYDLVMRDKDYYEKTGGGVTLSGGEAMLHIFSIKPLLEKFRESNVHIAAETCGNVKKENIKAAFPLVNVFLFDIKTLDGKKIQKYTGGDLNLILDNFSYIAAYNPDKLIIRVPVLPNVNDKESDIREIFSLALSSKVKRVDLLPYHTLGLTKYKQLGLPYKFSCHESMKTEKLLPLKKLGEEMGLKVGIGG